MAHRRLPPGLTPQAPGPGQESVWDYPRPPAVDASDEVVEVRLHLPADSRGHDPDGIVLLRTTAAYRVLETSHPPTYYLPLTDAVPGAFRPGHGSSFCEFKGTASYLDVAVPDGPVVLPGGAWTYPTPTPDYQVLVGHLALYPRDPLRCTVAGEVVTPQAGDFYGGWVTSRVVGPFKGEPGSAWW